MLVRCPMFDHDVVPFYELRSGRPSASRQRCGRQVDKKHCNSGRPSALCQTRSESETAKERPCTSADERSEIRPKVSGAAPPPQRTNGSSEAQPTPNCKFRRKVNPNTIEMLIA